jgi:hypothetical protein
MRRISGDYSAVTEGQCVICFRHVYPGMTIFSVELKGGRRGVAHSLCEALKKSEEAD